MTFDKTGFVSIGIVIRKYAIGIVMSLMAVTYCSGVPKRYLLEADATFGC